MSSLGHANTAMISVLGVVDGTGCPDKSGAYLMLDVSEKSGRQYRLRISIGGAEILQAEIAGVLGI